MPKIVDAIALFFDDVRVEVGNKYSFMGMYQKTLNFPEGAATDLQKLFLLIVVRFSSIGDTKSLKFFIKLPKDETLELEPEWPPPGEDWSDGDMHSAQIIFQLGPIKMDNDSSIRVEVIADANMILAGSLQFRQISNVETIPIVQAVPKSKQTSRKSKGGRQ
jgi:hypothetical protein